MSSDSPLILKTASISFRNGKLLFWQSQKLKFYEETFFPLSFNSFRWHWKQSLYLSQEKCIHSLQSIVWPKWVKMLSSNISGHMDLQQIRCFIMVFLCGFNGLLFWKKNMLMQANTSASWVIIKVIINKRST